MSNNTENLTEARESFEAAYSEHKALTAESDVHGAFRMLTREGRRLVTPTPGLGAERRASRLARARGLAVAAQRLTSDASVTERLDDVIYALNNVTVSTPDADAVTED